MGRHRNYHADCVNVFVEEFSSAPSNNPGATPLSSTNPPEAPLERSIFVFPGRSIRGGDQYAVSALRNISSMDKDTVAEAKQFLWSEKISASEGHPFLKVHIGENGILGFALDQGGKQCTFSFCQESTGPPLDGTITIDKGQLIYQGHGAKYISAVAIGRELLDAGHSIKCEMEEPSSKFTFRTVYIRPDMAFDVVTPSLGSRDASGTQFQSQSQSTQAVCTCMAPYGLEYESTVWFWCSLGHFKRKFLVRGRLALPAISTTENFCRAPQRWRRPHDIGHAAGAKRCRVQGQGTAPGCEQRSRDGQSRHARRRARHATQNTRGSCLGQ
jgi:hypothetical protein